MVSTQSKYRNPDLDQVVAANTRHGLRDKYTATATRLIAEFIAQRQPLLDELVKLPGVIDPTSLRPKLADAIQDHLDAKYSRTVSAFTVGGFGPDWQQIAEQVRGVTAQEEREQRLARYEEAEYEPERWGGLS